jgi:SAM-dependent methyltransferase
VAEPEYVALNRASWTTANAEYTDRAARAAWAREEIGWGQWHQPEREIQMLPEVAGKDVVELGCGTAYFGAWLKRAGARRVVGVDVTPAQLDTARRMDEEFGVGLELIEANAEDVPLPDESFDVVASEYGASIWCDPKLWIAEAARLLRPGGELVFMRGSTLRNLCVPDSGPATDRLLLPQKGFELLDYRELYAPDDAETHEYYAEPSADWARKWPAEEIWRARLRPRSS